MITHLKHLQLVLFYRGRRGESEWWLGTCWTTFRLITMHIAWQRRTLPSRAQVLKGTSEYSGCPGGRSARRHEGRLERGRGGPPEGRLVMVRLSRT